MSSQRIIIQLNSSRLVIAINRPSGARSLRRFMDGWIGFVGWMTG